MPRDREMEGDSRQRRAVAREAREAGKRAGEVGGTLGASKQRTEADDRLSHQERLDLKRAGKQNVSGRPPAGARPGSRDADTADREGHPRR